MTLERIVYELGPSLLGLVISLALVRLWLGWKFKRELADQRARHDREWAEMKSAGIAALREEWAQLDREAIVRELRRRRRARAAAAIDLEAFEPLERQFELERRLEEDPMKHRMKRAACPTCGDVHDAASNAEAVSAAPEPGDFSVCGSCGAINRFDAVLGLEPVTESDLPSIHPENRRLLELARAAVRRARPS